jgi:hypothetical protein
MIGEIAQRETNEETAIEPRVAENTRREPSVTVVNVRPKFNSRKDTSGGGVTTGNRATRAVSIHIITTTYLGQIKPKAGKNPQDEDQI